LPAPSDAVVLFDGKDLSAWHPAPTWKLEDGEIVAGEGKLIFKATFGDVQIHLQAGVAFNSVECTHRAGGCQAILNSNASWLRGSMTM
jgi:hypothetical protein